MEKVIKLLVVTAGIILYLNIGGIAVVAQNSNQANDEQTLKTLINEVRLLRKTLLLINLNGYKSQLLLNRLKYRMENIEKLQNKLEEVQSQVTDIPTNIERFSEQLKALETRMQQEQNEEIKQNYESSIKEINLLISSQRQLLAQLQEKEKLFSSQIQNEQSKRDELENALQQIEQKMDTEINKQFNGLVK
jgi:chromosome segregation ATPase